MTKPIINGHHQFSETISLLRFPLIVVVIYIHIIHESISPLKFDFTIDSIYHFIYTVISQNFGRVVVPCFFLFSGYLFFFKIKAEYSLDEYKKQLRKRFKTLVIPYFLWNIIMVSIVIIKNLSIRYINGNYDELWDYINQSTVYDILWNDPINYPLWYLRDLIIMSLISPLLFYYKKYLGNLGLIILFLFYLSNIEIPLAGFTSTAIFFFSMGMYFTNNINSIISFINKNFLIILITTILLLTISTLCNGTEYYKYAIKLFTIPGILTLIGLGNRIQKYEEIVLPMNKLAQTVFFIYAIHVIYIINWVKGAFFRISIFNDGIMKIATYFIMPIVILLITLAIYYTLKKIFPKALNILNGSR